MRHILLVTALSLAACGGGAIRSGGLDSEGGGATGTGATGGTSGGTSSTGGAATSPNFLFGPYKDVTISANWNTNVISTAVTGTIAPVTQAVPQAKTITWAFATGECGAENWGGISAATLATANVQAFQTAGVNYILSTGGADGTFTCGSDANFSAFIDRYASTNLVGIDFDIEGGQTPAQVDDLVARVKAAKANPKYANLRFSFTIASLAGNTPQSLGAAGEQVMKSIQDGGLEGAIINLMTMDYGSATPVNCTMKGTSCDMGASATQAALNLNSAYNVPFSQIELTPMIGGNDTQGETFSIDDVKTVTAFATQKNLAGVHMWSLDRDKDCPAGSASPTCNSYGTAGTLGFLSAFVNNL